MNVMPDLCSPTRAFRHRVDGAVESLRRLGVEAERIVIRFAGPGWAPGTVVDQDPAPGAPLPLRAPIVLTVAGSGGLDLLPYPLRDARDDGLGADGLMALFDNPLARLALHVRRAGGFLALHPEDEPVVLRWIQVIFDLAPEPLSPERWYPLARLLPVLHQVAGTEAGVRLAMQLVFGLPVASVDARSGLVRLPPEARTRLGRAASRLGVDAVAGPGVVAPCVLEITLGPLTLAQWREHQRPMLRAERQAVYRLVVPAAFHGAVREVWAVASPAAGARPGHPDAEPVLGVNARLGTTHERSAA